jgi:hypothetical protein
MAQTRAISRALRAPLGQIVVLAGYEPASAEEMPAESAEPAASRNDATQTPSEPKVTEAQMARIRAVLAELAVRDPNTDWASSAREFIGVPASMLTETSARRLIEWLENTAGTNEGPDAG